MTLFLKITQNGISRNLLNLLRDFLNETKQQVNLNRRFSTWKNINAGVPQGSILRVLLFLIYIDDLTEGLSSNAMLLADDTSLFSFMDDIQASASNLYKDLKKISDWPTQCKMNFNPDTTKQTQEVIFSHKFGKKVHLPLLLNNASITQTSSQKHLEIILDNRLKIHDVLKMVSEKIRKTIGLCCKLLIFLPRAALITTYKAFIIPHFDYFDIVYDQAYMLESIECNACLAITGANKVHGKKSFTKN